MRRRLRETIVLLTLLTTSAVTLSVLYSAGQTVEQISRSLVLSTMDRTEAELARFFQPVTQQLHVARGWGEAGLLDPREPDRMVALLAPVLRDNPQVSSLLLASTTGDEFMLLETEDGFVSRLTRLHEEGWGRKTRWITWSPRGARVREEVRELDYDPRTRPWYRGATERRPGEIHWTEPYAFFTTHDPGITASVRWRTGDGPDHILAFDVMLLDVSQFTTGLDVSKRGDAVVLAEDGRVLGLPNDARFQGRQRIQAAVLTPIAELSLPAFGALRSQTNPGDVVRYEPGDEHWWGGVRRFEVGDGRHLEIAVAVPEEDLQGPYESQRDLVIAISLGALLLAVLVSILLERWLEQRLAQQVRQARQVGQYTLDMEIGRGGMGTVYRARHAMLRRPTAVKLLRSAEPGSRAIRRFEREVQLTSRLTHPNTIAVYDFGRTPQGTFYYAMEYLDGVTLRRLVERTGPLGPGRAIHVLRQVCGSLAEAHRVGLIHRDIKPSNIMLCERGGIQDFVKVLDFGLVKQVDAGENSQALTGQEGLTGTPLYIAPEAALRPNEVDARSDLYAVGALAYYLLTGRPPFTGNSGMEVISKHLKVPATPPSEALGRPLPPDLESIVMDCLEKEPDRRPTSATTLEARLAACVSAGAWGQESAIEWWETWNARFSTRPDVDDDESALTLSVDLDRRAPESAPADARPSAADRTITRG